MTDPKNTENQSEELSVDELEGVAGAAISVNTNLTSGIRDVEVASESALKRPKTGWSSTDAEFNG